MIAHVVLYRARPDVTIDEKTALADAVRRTCREAPTVQRLTIAKTVDVGAGYLGGADETAYEYIAIIEFADRAGLMSYLAHPAHQELSRLFWKACEATKIIDAETFDRIET